jgi:hypothetical protein
MKPNNMDDGRGAGNGKKAYRRPETLSREQLEALAVICDTGKTDPLSCPAGPLQS